MPANSTSRPGAMTSGSVLPAAAAISSFVGLRILLTGATGMIGQGVLRECLLDPDIERVVTLGRSTVGKTHPKLNDVVTRDLFDLADVEQDLTNLDACFFCLGVTSAGMSEAAYTRITHDLTVSIAQTLLRLNPGMGFIFVSG